jgi:hypothetical protein
MGASGTLVLTNETGESCRLTGIARLSLVGRSGASLAVAYRQPTSPVRPLVLAAGASAQVIVYWWNWCGSQPGPLAVRITLPGHAGTLVAPFDGPPADRIVPACLSCAKDSWVAIADAFEPYEPGPPVCVPQGATTLRLSSGLASRVRVGQLVEIEAVESASFQNPAVYPAAISPWEAARSSNVFVVEPVARCGRAATLGLPVYVAEFRAVSLGRVVLTQPLSPAWRAVKGHRPAPFRAAVTVDPAR